jgi:hypothetical protein
LAQLKACSFKSGLEKLFLSLFTNEYRIFFPAMGLLLSNISARKMDFVRLFVVFFHPTKSAYSQTCIKR